MSSLWPFWESDSLPVIFTGVHACGLCRKVAQSDPDCKRFRGQCVKNRATVVARSIGRRTRSGNVRCSLAGSPLIRPLERSQRSRVTGSEAKTLSLCINDARMNDWIDNDNPQSCSFLYPDRATSPGTLAASVNFTFLRSLRSAKGVRGGRRAVKRNSGTMGRGLNASAQRANSKLSPTSAHKSNKSDFSGNVPRRAFPRAYLNHP